MGVDIPDVQQVIYWGAPTDLESYIQATGRAGRNGELCCGILYYGKKNNRFLDEKMIDYCTNNKVCKRQLLFDDFEGCSNFVPTCKCYCCSFCMNDCKCSITEISKQSILCNNYIQLKLIL
jgi:ATP-dependent DNA helicase RecQ